MVRYSIVDRATLNFMDHRDQVIKELHAYYGDSIKDKLVSEQTRWYDAKNTLSNALEAAQDKSLLSKTVETIDRISSKLTELDMNALTIFRAKEIAQNFDNTTQKQHAAIQEAMNTDWLRANQKVKGVAQNLANAQNEALPSISKRKDAKSELKSNSDADIVGAVLLPFILAIAIFIYTFIEITRDDPTTGAKVIGVIFGIIAGAIGGVLTSVVAIPIWLLIVKIWRELDSENSASKKIQQQTLIREKAEANKAKNVKAIEEKFLNDNSIFKKQEEILDSVRPYFEKS